MAEQMTELQLMSKKTNTGFAWTRNESFEEWISGSQRPLGS